MPKLGLKQLPFFGLLIAGCVLHSLIFFYPIPVYYLPDLFLLIYLVYKFPDLNQDVSLVFFLGLALLIGYYFFSPQPPETEFSNNYIVVLKPFAYICILALYSRNVPQVKLVYGVYF